MKIVKPSAELLWMTTNPLQTIETAGRTCYKSESRATILSAAAFVKMLLQRDHESVLEHVSMSYRIICDRGVTHELVRHRLFSYSQESTRYCNYGNKDIEFIQPPMETDKQILEWKSAMEACEESYKWLIDYKCRPEIARSVLPNSLKTEIVTTGNFREWRHFFKMRTSPHAHPQMREVANMILKDARSRVPIIFDEYVQESE